MLVRIRAAWEAIRASLFFVPLLYLVLGAGLAVGLLELDIRLDASDFEFPFILRSTVASARSLLSTIAGATITVAGIAFSVSLLLFQLASSQYSPRVLHGLFRDTFTKRVLGLVVATFTFCLLVLRAVRDGIGDEGVAIVPNVSVLVALLAGIGSILAIVAFINHTAHTMDAADIIRRITADTKEQVERLAVRPEDSNGDAEPEMPEVPPGAFVVTAKQDGWVQVVDSKALMGAADEGATIRLETFPGAFAAAGEPIVTMWPAPEDREQAVKEAREAIRIGRGRTMQEDLGYGIRQLVDVALRALSPGVNDPTTANEVTSHLGSILRDLLIRDLPPRVAERKGRTLYRPYDLTHARFVELAFEQIRRSGASQPSVIRRLLDTIGPLAVYIEAAGYPERAEMLRRQARLALEGAAAAGALEEDLASLRRAAAANGLAT